MGSDAAAQLHEYLGYSELKDLRLEIHQKDTSFSFCFWVYLLKSTPFPSTILLQVFLST
ncbi:hypothetical protein Dimus_018747 [Dionaea muscipula]